MLTSDHSKEEEKEEENMDVQPVESDFIELPPIEVSLHYFISHSKQDPLIIENAEDEIAFDNLVSSAFYVSE